MPLSFEQQNFLCDIQDAEPGSREEANALAFIQTNPIEFEEDNCYWTPLITAISRKRTPIIDALLAKGTDIYYVARSGTTALSAAIRAQNTLMIDFLTPHYKAQFGEDRIIVDELIALIDNYYPTGAINTDIDIRDYRAKTMPRLQQYRTQPTPLSQATLQFLREEIAEFRALICERDLAIQKRELEASRYKDEKEREAFLKLDKAARLAALEVRGQEISAKAALEEKLHKETLARQAMETRCKELEEKLKQEGAQLEDLSGRLEQVEVKMNVLWLAHETEMTITREKAFIRSQTKLKIFFDRTRCKLNDIMTGAQVLRSGAVAVADPTSRTAKGIMMTIELVGQLVPVPGIDKLASLTSLLMSTYLKHKQQKQTERAHAGLTSMASDVMEWNEEIVDPVARRLSLLGARQLPHFGDNDVALLAEYSVVLMLFYMIYEHDPHKTPVPSYAEIVQSLLLAVRFQHYAKAGRVVKNENGESIKAPLLSKSTGAGASKVSAVEVLRAFENDVPAGLIPVATRPLPAMRLAPKKAASITASTESKTGIVKPPVLAATPARASDPAMPAQKGLMVSVQRAPASASNTALPAVPVVKLEPVTASELRSRSVSPAPPPRATSPAPQPGLLRRVFKGVSTPKATTFSS